MCRHGQQLGTEFGAQRLSSIYSCVPPVTPVSAAPELPLQERIHKAALLRGIVVFLFFFQDLGEFLYEEEGFN